MRIPEKKLFFEIPSRQVIQPFINMAYNNPVGLINLT